MDKTPRHYSFSGTDLKRLEESFFSPPPKKHSRRVSKKNIVYIISLIVVVAVGTIAFLSLHNSSPTLKESPSQTVNNAPVSLPEEGKSTVVNFPVPVTVKFLGNTQLQGDKVINIPVPPRKKTGIAISLKDTLDLSNGEINFLISRPPAPLKILMVMRDFNYFSNTFSPYTFEINPDDYPDGKYIQLPLKITQPGLFQLNIHHINQIKLFFVQNTNKDISLSIKNITFKGGR